MVIIVEGLLVCMSRQVVFGHVIIGIWCTCLHMPAQSCVERLHRTSGFWGELVLALQRNA